MLNFASNSSADCQWPMRLRSMSPQAGHLIEVNEASKITLAFIRHFRDNLSTPLTLTDIAEEMGYSIFGVIRAFRQTTGITPMRYLSILRLAEAKRLLLTSDLSVIMVCFEVGYESLGSFNNRFKALVGMTPTGVRKLLDTLNPAALLRDCDYLEKGNPMVCGIAQFKPGAAYSHLEGLYRTRGRMAPEVGLTSVGLAAPWSDDPLEMLLPRMIYRTDPVELGYADAMKPIRPLKLRASTMFDPPVLPFVAAALLEVHNKQFGRMR